MVTSDVSYTVHRTTAPTKKLLTADEASWRSASRVTWGPEVYATHFRALWSEKGLYLRYDAVDPSPWHTMNERNAHLWEEEVVEIFIDPDSDGRNYAEIEINPANVVCDLIVFEASPNLRSDIDWNFAGLETSVTPLRSEEGGAVGWIAVAVLPWKGFRNLPEIAAAALPPRSGDAWRFNVFRIKRPGGRHAPEKNVVYAAWSPVTGRSFHEPAVFPKLSFMAE